MLKNNVKNHFFFSLGLLVLLSLPISSMTQEILDLTSLQQKWICNNNRPLKTYIAQDLQDKKKGLSFLKPKDFIKNRGLYFSYAKTGLRRFWMPSTFFPLDIIFLNRDMTIVAIERNVKPSPFTSSSDKDIPTTKTYIAKDVLEIRAKSSWGTGIKKGSQLNWCLPESALLQRGLSTPAAQ